MGSQAGKTVDYKTFPPGRSAYIDLLLQKQILEINLE